MFACKLWADVEMTNVVVYRELYAYNETQQQYLYKLQSLAFQYLNWYVSIISEIIRVNVIKITTTIMNEKKKITQLTVRKHRLQKMWPTCPSSSVPLHQWPMPILDAKILQEYSGIPAYCDPATYLSDTFYIVSHHPDCWSRIVKWDE